MKLKEILQKLVDDGNQTLLHDGQKFSGAGELLAVLPERTLERQVHLQPGLYIAELSDRGYLGSVLYKIDNRRPNN
ncbi:hypothetical protein JW935_22375 [candidate division KSB1 bacterium]|nr:hypothetical protein [candidate division KSB1 bacterium]